MGQAVARADSRANASKRSSGRCSVIPSCERCTFRRFAAFDPDTNSRSNYNRATDALHRPLWPIRTCVDLGGTAGVRGNSNAGYATAASGTAKLRDEKPMKQPKAAYTLLSTLVLSAVVSTAAQDMAGTRQVYDGTMRPDVEVKTFAHYDELFPVRTVERGGATRKLPRASTALKNVVFCHFPVAGEEAQVGRFCFRRMGDAVRRGGPVDRCDGRRSGGRAANPPRLRLRARDFCHLPDLRDVHSFSSLCLVARNRPSNPGLELFEKSKIDGLGHGAVAKIVRMVLISRGKTRQHSLGVIRLVGEQLDPVGVRPPEPGYNSNTSMAVSA